MQKKPSPETQSKNEPAYLFSLIYWNTIRLNIESDSDNIEPQIKKNRG